MRCLFAFKLIILFSLAVSSCFPHEGRGIWVVRYRLASPAVLDGIVKDAQRGRFNLLFVQVHGRGDAYYRSQLEPRAEVLADTPPEYDPLAYILQQGHAAGLQIHAWLNVFYVWPYPPPYPLARWHVVNSHPEWLIADEEGRTLAQYDQYERAKEPSEGLYLDPANAQVRDYFLRICKEVVKGYKVDGIHLDFIRYPGFRWGYNREALEAFIRRWGVDPRLLSSWVKKPMPERFMQGRLPLHLRWHYYYHSLWAETRSHYITELVKSVHNEVKSIRPHVILSAAVLPDPQTAYYLKGQDWPTWLSQGYLDLIAPMAYHGDQTRVEAQMAEAKRRAQERIVLAGLGAWIKTPAQIRQEVEGLREIGVDGFSYFSYQGMKEQDEGYINQARTSLHHGRASLPRVKGKGGGTKAINTPPNPLQADGAGLFWRALKKQFFSLEDYHELLRRLGMEENGFGQKLKKEVARLEVMTQELYHRAQPSPDEEVLLPPSVDLQVIFRYVHPKDGPQTRNEAYMAIHEAYQRVMDGEDFAQVAMKCSQGTTAGLGGVRDRIYLQDGWDLAEIVSSFQAGEITPVIQVPNGYLIYKILAFHPPEKRNYGDLPWWLKRVVFQERLAQLVEGGW
ncbi:MAG: family 10 glycosylhydrolase [Deltaproteobacteria bacterium]|nr:MAG: family 10 glycosylhydrolase [Deltaproteobacteria bacterium]